MKVGKTVWPSDSDGAHAIFSHAMFDTAPPERQGRPRRQSCNSGDHTTVWSVTLTDCHQLCHCHSSFLGRTDEAEKVMDISHTQEGTCIPQKSILFSIKSLFWPNDFFVKRVSQSSVDIVFYQSYAEGNISEGMCLSDGIRHGGASCSNADHDESLQCLAEAVYSDTHSIIICH